MLKWVRSFGTDMSEHGSYSGSVIVDKHVGNIRGQQRVAPQHQAWGQGFYSTPNGDAQPQMEGQPPPPPPPPPPQQPASPGLNVAPALIPPAETYPQEYRFSRSDSETTMTDNALYESHILARPPPNMEIPGQNLQGQTGLIDSGALGQAQMPQGVPPGQNQMYDTFIHAQGQGAPTNDYDTFIASQGAPQADLAPPAAAYNLQGRYQLSGNTLPPQGIASQARPSGPPPYQNVQLPAMAPAPARNVPVDVPDARQQVPQNYIPPAPVPQIQAPPQAPAQPAPLGQHQSQFQGSQGSLGSLVMSTASEQPQVVDLRKQAMQARGMTGPTQGQTTTLPAPDSYRLAPAQTSTLPPAQIPSLTLLDVERSRTAYTSTTPGGSIISPGAKLSSVEGTTDLRLVNSLSPELQDNARNIEWVDLRAASSHGRLDNYQTAPPGFKTASYPNLLLPALTHSPQLGASASALGETTEPRELVLGPQEPHRWSATGTLPMDSGLPQNGVGRAKSPSIVTAHSSYSDFQNGGVLYTAGLESGTAITRPVDRKQSQTTQTGEHVVLNPTMLLKETLTENPDENKRQNGVANGRPKPKVIRIRPTPLTEEEKAKKRQKRRRVMIILFVLALFVLLVAAVALGVVFGLRAHE